MFTTFFADVPPRAILVIFDHIGASLPWAAFSSAPTVLLMDGLTFIVYAPDHFNITGSFMMFAGLYP